MFEHLGVALIVVIVASSATCYGIAALWALGIGADWFWRAAPLALLLAALVPIGAYDPLAMFSAQAVVVILGVLAARLTTRCVRYLRARVRAVSAEAARQAATPPRFGIIDVLKAVVLLAAVLGLIRLAPTV